MKSTKTKIFCSCPTEFGGEPNTHCCPVCIAMPGTLPVLNEKVVEYAVKAGLATNCKISQNSKNDRKNYFYPDLPKAYQISQYDMPLCYEGFVNIETEDGEKKIRLTRIHIEEDAGKLNHDEYGRGSFVDLNEFIFFISVLVPNSVLPFFLTETLTSALKEPSCILQSETSIYSKIDFNFLI